MSHNDLELPTADEVIARLKKQALGMVAQERQSHSHTDLPQSMLRQELRVLLYGWTRSENIVEELEILLVPFIAQQVTAAREKLYEGGEKKFIQMLLAHGVEYAQDILEDNTLFRIPNATLNKYRDGELQPTTKQEPKK